LQASESKRVFSHASSALVGHLWERWRSLGLDASASSNLMKMNHFFRAQAGFESGKMCSTNDPFLLLKFECALQASNETWPDFEGPRKRQAFRQNPNLKFGISA